MAFSGDDGDANRYRELMGPSVVDCMIREAIKMCWFGMRAPQAEKLKAVQTEVRRVVERALKDLAEDIERLGS